MGGPQAGVDEFGADTLDRPENLNTGGIAATTLAEAFVGKLDDAPVD